MNGQRDGVTGSVAYRAVRWISRTLVALFYHRVEVTGLRRLPRTGPLIVVANHQNALVDGMLLLATIPRPLVSLAKAPLFRNPLIGPFLKALGAIPVHRRQDTTERFDPDANARMFDAATATLSAGGAILIFPEGVSQPEPALMPLKTGAARIVLAAESAGPEALGVTVVPVGLVFDEPGTFRTGWAVVTVGAPVVTADCVALFRQEPVEAVRRLTDRLSDALARLIVEAGDRETLRLVQVVESVWRAEAGGVDRPADIAAWRRRVARAHRYLAEREPDRIARLRGEVERYAKALELAGLGRGRSATHPVRVGAATRYVLRESLAIVLGLPLAAWGLVVHAAPYTIVRWAIRLVRPEPDVEATYKIAGGLVVYLVCWVVGGLDPGPPRRRVGGGPLRRLAGPQRVLRARLDRPGGTDGARDAPGRAARDRPRPPGRHGRATPGDHGRADRALRAGARARARRRPERSRGARNP